MSAVTAGSLLAGQLLPPVTGRAEAGEVAPKGPVADRDVKAMQMSISYATEVLSPPKSGGEVKFWIPLPQSDQEQEITSLSIDSPVAFNINQEAKFGNRIVHVRSSEFRAGDRITLTYNLRRLTSGTIKDREEDVKKHLVLTENERINNAIRSFTDDVTGGEKDPMKVARKIFNALVDYLTYDKTIPGCGMGISAWTYKNRGGRCDDFHALFRTMMIYKGIPVRWEQGIPLPYPSEMAGSGKLEGDCTGAHCWVRFHAGDGNWVPVDVSEADKRPDLREYFFGTISPNRFKVSTGRDIILNPPQGGDPLNTFPFAYGEARGIPLIYSHNFSNEILYVVEKVEV